ncbi:MAG: DUF1232 domain-containing protein [Chloroflexi bacterium]|nr:DUF1232 domain-containing protein [Chloroflexota bacterium]
MRRLAADPTCPRWLGPVLLVSAAYLAFPFDLIPDFIPVLGQLDDLLLVAALAALLRWAIPRELVRRYFVKPMSESEES